MICANGIWQCFDAMEAAFVKDLSHADLEILMVESVSVENWNDGKLFDIGYSV